jgi:hypothetical protein
MARTTPAIPTSRLAPATPLPKGSLACQDVIATRDTPDSDLSVVLNAVALPTRDALQANRSGEVGPADRLFAKRGLLVASGASFELIVPSDWVGKLSVGWGNPAPRTPHLHVSACKAAGSQKTWLVFAGGFWVADAACVPLLVKAGSGQELVHIGVGAACPGQAPPPTPG